MNKPKNKRIQVKVEFDITATSEEELQLAIQTALEDLPEGSLNYGRSGHFTLKRLTGATLLAIEETK